MLAFVVCALLLVGIVAWVITRPLDTIGSLLAGTILIAGTAAIYLTVGTPTALNSPEVQESVDLDSALAELQLGLDNDPDNLEGWVLLARLQAQQRDYPAAVNALEQARKLDPNSPIIKTELAEALMFSRPDQPPPARAEQLLQQALANNPDLQKALWLSGVIAASRGNAVTARLYWNRLLQQMDPETPVYQSVSRQLQALNGNTNRAEPTADSATTLVAVNLAVSGAIEVGPEAVVFVIVRSAEQQGPPLAVRRLSANDLPTEIKLTTADAMLPDTQWQNLQQLTVQARLAQDGMVQPSSVDLVSPTVPFQPFNDQLLDLEISPVPQ